MFGDVDFNSFHRIQREMIDELRRELAKREDHLRSCQNRAESRKQALVRHSREGKALQLTQQKTEDYAEELRDALDKETVEDGHLEALQATVKEAEAELHVNEGSYQDCLREIEGVVQRLKETRRGLAEKDKELAALNQTLEAAQREEFGITDRRQEVLRTKNAAIRKIAALNQEKMRLGVKRDQVAKRIAEYNEKAGLVSARVQIDDGETPVSLDRKLERSHRELEIFNQQ